MSCTTPERALAPLLHAQRLLPAPDVADPSSQYVRACCAQRRCGGSSRSVKQSAHLPLVLMTSLAVSVHARMLALHVADDMCSTFCLGARMLRQLTLGLLTCGMYLVRSAYWCCECCTKAYRGPSCFASDSDGALRHAFVLRGVTDSDSEVIWLRDDLASARRACVCHTWRFAWPQSPRIRPKLYTRGLKPNCCAYCIFDWSKMMHRNMRASGDCLRFKYDRALPLARDTTG